ncbi:ATP-binding protein [Tissierella praeacuta]|uniref:sensor histidine kinase n=1 Tax=Tissierella praeacuta TaxID=43131 RepID=UPI00333F8D75
MRTPIFVLCIFIIMINYIVIFLHHKSYNFYIALRNETTKQLFSKLSEDYFNKIQEESKEISKLWHDMNNQILVMEGINNNHISDGYLDSLKYKMDSVSKSLKTGNHILDIILNNKYLEATKKGIDFDVKATIPSTILVEDIDLSSILFNTIDNAIEANLNCILDKKYIKLVITKEDNFIYYKIKNSYSKIGYKDIYRYFNRKNNIDSGYGLNIVKDIVYKYNGNITIDQSKHEYSVTIIIPL